MAPCYPRQRLTTALRTPNSGRHGLRSQRTQPDFAHLPDTVEPACAAPGSATLWKEVGALALTVSDLHIQLDEAEKRLRQRKAGRPSDTRGQSDVASLKARLKATQEKLHFYQLALSPILRLPPEIIGEIFNALLDTLEQVEKRRMLAQLGQVCRAWNPPLHNPSHWATVKLRLTDRNSFRDLGDIEAHFRGSGDLPRTLILEGEGCPCGDPSERKKWQYCYCRWRTPTTELLCRPNMIRRLVLAKSTFRCFTNLMASLSATQVTGHRAWSSIQTMELDFLSFGALGQAFAGENGPPRSKAKAVFDFLDLPPSLTRLTLKLPGWSSHVKTGFDFQTQSLRNLTSLAVYCDWNTPDVLLTLQQCQGLRSLTLDFDKSPHSYKCTIYEVALPHLQSLDITVRNYCAGATILSLFVLPMLEDLRLFVDFTHDDREVKRRLTYLKLFPSGSPSRPSLRSLEIHSCTVMGLKRKIGVDFLIFILSNIPSLRTFTLDRMFFDAQLFVENLRRRIQNNGRDVFPHIRSLRLLDVDGGLDVFDIDAFLQFVMLLRCPSPGEPTREAGSPPEGLRSIVFGYSDWMLEDQLEKQNHQYALASATIRLLQNAYYVVVDRLFISDRGR